LLAAAGNFTMRPSEAGDEDEIDDDPGGNLREPGAPAVPPHASGTAVLFPVSAMDLNPGSDKVVLLRSGSRAGTHRGAAGALQLFAGVQGSVVAASESDRALLAAALRGDDGAAQALAQSLADLVWTACRRVTAGVAEAEDAFGAIMTSLQANRFERLRGYDGRAQVRVYAALVVRDLLSERTINLLVTDAARGWSAFEAFFGDDIRRMIVRMLPGTAHQLNREDAYQSVCESLLRNDHQRLRAYSGRGSPSGFVLQAVENLVIDFVRTVIPRRRLPAAIQRLGELDQAVFRLVYWEHISADPAVLLRHLGRPGAAAPTLVDVADALARVRRDVPPGYHPEARREGQTVSLSAAEEVAVAGGAEDFAVRTPEQNLVETETSSLLDQAIGVLQQVLPRLAAAERLYLQLALTGQPAREIARIVGCPAEEIHKLAQKVKKRLRDEMGDHEAVKKWRLSV
jgi:RNA polymerase primary sigma factor